MLLLIPIALIAFAAFAGIASLRQRLQDAAPPRPSLKIRAWIVAGASLATIALQLLSWLPLRPIVAPNASAGSVVYGGPGDGLWLLLVIATWVVMQPINVLMACFCARSVKQAALIASVLIGAWIGTAALGGALTRCPAGFVCTGG